MQQYIFRQESCGSVLTIDLFSENDPTLFVQDCFSICERFEQHYSRFISGNRLDQLNHSPWVPVELDDEAYVLLSFSLDLARKTHGAFDPTIIRTLESYGYDSSYSFQRREWWPTWYQHVELSDHSVILHHDVAIEFGAVGKGYLLDVLAGKLRAAWYTKFLLDFGWDIIADGWYDIALENPFDLSQAIGTIHVDGFAIAASNGAKRKVKDFHHLLDAHTGKPIVDIAGVYIAAPTGLIADAYSTAVFVSWAEKGKELLAAEDDITGVMVFADGTYWQKAWYTWTLFT